MSLLTFCTHFSCHLGTLTNLISFAMTRMLLFVVLFEIFCSVALAKCYYPDGSDMRANYRPCDSSKEFNMYCAEGDECRPDGLCFNNQSNLIYRDPVLKKFHLYQIMQHFNPSIRAEKACGRKYVDA